MMLLIQLYCNHNKEEEYYSFVHVVVNIQNSVECHYIRLFSGETYLHIEVMDIVYGKYCAHTDSVAHKYTITRIYIVCDGLILEGVGFASIFSTYLFYPYFVKSQNLQKN